MDWQTDNHGIEPKANIFGNNYFALLYLLYQQSLNKFSALYLKQIWTKYTSNYALHSIYTNGMYIYRELWKPG